MVGLKKKLKKMKMASSLRYVTDYSPWALRHAKGDQQQQPREKSLN